MAWLVGLLTLLAAYLLGSIPTGYLIAKAVRGIDIREHGSGNTGATNVMRVVGKAAGIAVLLIDLCKGLLAVLMVQGLLTASYADQSTWLSTVDWWITGAGGLAILGHSRSVWLNWTGGKSAATGLGVLLALYWPAGLGAAAVFAVALGCSRIVSLSSIMAALAAVVFMVVFQQPWPYLLLAIAGSLYVILRHRTNIQRLLEGTEPRLGSRTPTS
ncbi:glycerol-3-phosphate 1-O-acyltransferase PlsY [Halomicronema sp. CCY15110]|uniref:glycerol-3-phosphate 1-O-acyltransferase PlsY n=1 Tax=Halomicronema sp. CCY15110 TaxID=2767773 RepID=UPI00194E655E|nr:glycerol-3-phosphate 1-O-acyltransferase PlsY [Halomicronema sp. CCY15110]